MFDDLDPAKAADAVRLFQLMRPTDLVELADKLLNDARDHHTKRGILEEANAKRQRRK